MKIFQLFGHAFCCFVRLVKTDWNKLLKVKLSPTITRTNFPFLRYFSIQIFSNHSVKAVFDKLLNKPFETECWCVTCLLCACPLFAKWKQDKLFIWTGTHWKMQSFSSLLQNTWTVLFYFSTTYQASALSKGLPAHYMYNQSKHVAWYTHTHTCMLNHINKQYSVHQKLKPEQFLWK